MNSKFHTIVILIFLNLLTLTLQIRIKNLTKNKKSIKNSEEIFNNIYNDEVQPQETEILPEKNNINESDDSFLSRLLGFDNVSFLQKDKKVKGDECGCGNENVTETGTGKVLKKKEEVLNDETNNNLIGKSNFSQIKSETKLKNSNKIKRY